MLCGSGSKYTMTLAKKKNLIGPLTGVLGVEQNTKRKPFMHYFQSTVERVTLYYINFLIVWLIGPLKQVVWRQN